MISIIITAFKESKTIERAIRSIAEQELPINEIIVIAPDDETLHAAKKLSNKYKQIKLIKDFGRGKPAALNLAVSKATGDILILTDGDVFVGKDSIEYLISLFHDKKIGAATGRPISISPRNNKYGFWAYLLTEIAHERRRKAFAENKRFFCSGYLFAIRKKIFPKLSEELLSEDGYISHKVYESGYKIAYAEKAEVYVKYPDNFKDWIKQKRRSVGGYNQIKKMISIDIRSFSSESSGGFAFLKYIGSIQGMFWLFELFMARIYLWLVIYRDINIRKKSQKELWERVESTK